MVFAHGLMISSAQALEAERFTRPDLATAAEMTE